MCLRSSAWSSRFSLSSTLEKRAESPGVLVAVWRMIAVSVVWNVLLSHNSVADAGPARVPDRAPVLHPFCTPGKKKPAEAGFTFPPEA